jgi:hypothetical protein
MHGLGGKDGVAALGVVAIVDSLGFALNQSSTLSAFTNGIAHIDMFDAQFLFGRVAFIQAFRPE